MGVGLGGRGKDTKWICKIREYKRIQKEKTKEYASGRQIYELCTGAERIEGSSRFLMWWDQEHGPNQKKR